MSDVDAPVLELADISKTFGRRGGAVKAVRGVTLSVGAGEVYGFLGPNGAGKSTTIRMLLGPDRADRGHCAAVRAGSRADPSVLRRVGSLVDGGDFYPFLSGRRNLEVLARTHGGGAERIDALLDQVGLAKDAKRKVKGYSTGMRQRLGVAAALLSDPDIVILDEPVNGLDAAGIQEMRAADPQPRRGPRQDGLPLQPSAQRGAAGLRPGRDHPQGRGGPRIDGRRTCSTRKRAASGSRRSRSKRPRRRFAAAGRWSGAARRCRRRQPGRGAGGGAASWSAPASICSAWCRCSATSRTCSSPSPRRSRAMLDAISRRGAEVHPPPRHLGPGLDLADRRARHRRDRHHRRPRQRRRGRRRPRRATAAGWIADAAGFWKVPGQGLGRYLIGAFVAVVFAGEYGWNTWKLIVPHRARRQPDRRQICRGAGAACLRLRARRAPVQRRRLARGRRHRRPIPAGIAVGALIKAHGLGALAALAPLLLTTAYVSLAAILTRSTVGRAR